MRFIVKVGDEMVGFSELEGGDPPMGTACGKFVPTERYASIQQHCKPEALQSIPNLTIEIEGGQLTNTVGQFRSWISALNLARMVYRFA
jgi:hypothetical protein